MNTKTKQLLDRLNENHTLELDEYEYLLSNADEESMAYAAAYAVAYQKKYYGNKVYIRGRNNCFYCGIRKDNNACERYRLSVEEILDCADTGYDLGFRTLVLQGGEDAFFSDEMMCEIIRGVKDSHPDMVVTLHACDTATDYALEKAVTWGASVIMCVPCCQHELNKQIECDILSPVMKYGLLKERFAALLTDGLRAEMLEASGYKTQILEFIDMEHTPKNILIRAVKRNTGKNNLQDRENTGKKDSGKTDFEKTAEFLHAEPTLQKLLFDKEKK